MRNNSLIFRLSAATAVAGLVLAQAIPQPALAQPAPPGGATAPDQQTGDPPERAGWLSQINGTVSYHGQDSDQWATAAMNYPVSTGDGFWTEPNASAQIMISASRIAMSGATELDIGNLDTSGLQATLPQGEVYLHLNDLAPNESWSVQTPRGLITFGGPGRYGIVAGDTQTPTVVTVLEGSVQVAGPGVSLNAAQGQAITINGADTFQGSVGPAQMDAFLTAMQQAERPPPTPAVAPPPAVAQMPGGTTLSAYGNWSETTDYGNVWYPQVASGWAPYREGHWAYVGPWGWTWVDAAPWGFAPFHYGRWVQVGGRWGWTPGVVAVAGPPVYAPALVAFVGIGVGVGIGAALASGSVGWCPLGPREVYRPWYHASPRYWQAVNRTNVTNVTNITTVINNRNVTINNFANRGAMTVVPAAAMASSRPVQQVAEHVNPQVLTTARPVFGTEPIRPTVATAGVTPAMAQRLRLPPAPAGAPVAARPAPGPAIRPIPHIQNAAARPPLLPSTRPGAAPEHAAPVPAAERPAGEVPGVRPGIAPAPGHGTPLPTAERPTGEAPGLRPGIAPAPEHAAPLPTAERPTGEAPGLRPGVVAPPGATHEATPAGVARPGAQPEHPVVTAPTEPGRPAAPQIAHPAVVPPREAEHPTPPVVEHHVVPAPQVHAPAEVHAVPRPEERPPQPAVHAAVRPEVHAPAPQPHPAPRPEVHAAPPPERAAPRPEVHPAAAPHPSHEEKKPEH